MKIRFLNKLLAVILLSLTAGLLGACHSAPQPQVGVALDDSVATFALEQGGLVLLNQAGAKLPTNFTDVSTTFAGMCLSYNAEQFTSALKLVTYCLSQATSFFDPARQVEVIHHFVTLNPQLAPQFTAPLENYRVYEKTQTILSQLFPQASTSLTQASALHDLHECVNYYFRIQNKFDPHPTLVKCFIDGSKKSQYASTYQVAYAKLATVKL